jgi:hypothetical protein
MSSGNPRPSLQAQSLGISLHVEVLDEDTHNNPTRQTLMRRMSLAMPVFKHKISANLSTGEKHMGNAAWKHELLPLK